VMIETGFISYGVRVAVRLADGSLLPALVERFPPGWRPASPPRADRAYSLEVAEPGGAARRRREYVLSAEGREAARSERLADVLDAFESDSRLFVAEVTTERVLLHAGAVAWGGRGVIIPGRSWSGKTTLVAELVRAGAAYFSDEYAVLDPDGLLHPYPKPLAVREGGADAQVNRPVESFGGRAATEPVPVSLVIVSEYRAGAVWEPARLSAGDGMLALSDNSISIRRSPQMVLETLGKALAGAEVRAGTRGEAIQVVDYLKEYYPPRKPQ
jgi:hypothetical protein